MYKNSYQPIHLHQFVIVIELKLKKIKIITIYYKDILEILNNIFH